MKYSVFDSYKEILTFLAIIFTVFIINLGFEYYEFKQFKQDKFKTIEAKVERSYLKTNKKGRIYRVLKLKTKDFSFYTTFKKEFDFKIRDSIKIGVITDKIKFKEYLKKSFYMPSYNPKIIQNKLNFKDFLIDKIISQHQNSKIQELYTTLYLATPISKELRDDVTKWGIAHIVSISGFHLGIIFATLFLILKPIYKFFQIRYFPYRSSYFDISVFGFLIMFYYLILLDFTPSFLRSLIMAFLGFIFLVRNLKILSFWTLFLTILLGVAFMPQLLFSIGFYFSCMGVYFIYLYLHHFKDKFSIPTNLILFNFYVYFAMNIPVYYFFGSVSLYQISVILIGYIFVIFYPLSVILHILNLGYLFDDILLKFLNYDIEIYQILIPAWLFYLVNLIALLGIRYKILAIIPAIVGIFPVIFIKDLF
ncbi:ComEC/Rec2 family competence protein [Campylobacter sp. FMV-PI01]|uniref:ComEC/Rec2 family competence protein n=1 Tax=Campylobacter portucalensis TaxID=2608384 RepID=A0A6L5WKB5_9BACT|nr:ComEC/Rec2 family competence protein [Campylobacter portucalensis]MSN96303.1 ComEC/Rec2 family competence protein [Campylobacter portucalensis]